MRIVVPGQARLSLVRVSPLIRLTRGPSRHHELFAASTRFSVVDSVGPAGRHPRAGGGVDGGAAGSALRRVGCREGRGGGLRARARRARGTQPGGADVPDVHLGSGGAGGLAGRRGGHPGGDGGHRPVLEAHLVSAGGGGLRAAAGQRPPRQDPPGRKTDVCDAAWLAELPEHGLLRGSFVPPASIRELRDLTRYRKRLIQAHGSEGQRIQKTLEDAGIKLDSVAADVLGVSGRAMLTALVNGERDPQVLAELAKGRLRAKLPQLRQALRGRFRAHHALLVRLALEHLEQLERSIAELDTQVDRALAPFARARDRLDTITGVGKRAAECMLAEIGVDMSVFPTAGHLASWAGRCPGNNVTGGKRRSGKPTKGNRWLGEILVECAWAAAHSRDTYLAAQFWRLARRIGKKKAAGAVGHSILVIAWHLLDGDCDYAELGGDFFVQRDTDRARQRAVAQLQALGYHVTLKQAAA